MDHPKITGGGGLGISFSGGGHGSEKVATNVFERQRSSRKKLSQQIANQKGLLKSLRGEERDIKFGTCRRKGATPREMILFSRKDASRILSTKKRGASMGGPLPRGGLLNFYPGAG